GRNHARPRHPGGRLQRAPGDRPSRPGGRPELNRFGRSARVPVGRGDHAGSGTLGGPSSDALALNPGGQAVGSSYTSSGDLHPFLWDGTAMRDLGTIGGSVNTTATAVNPAGRVTGMWFPPGPARYSRGVCRENGTMPDLGPRG